MDKDKKLAVIKRSLGLKHKLKVHDSMKAPETHDEFAVMMLARFELEDELKAIEEIIIDERKRAVEHKKAQILKDAEEDSPEGIFKKKDKFPPLSENDGGDSV